MHAREITASQLRLNSAIAADRLLVAARQLHHALKYNPDWQAQPRVSAGTPDGGQ